MKLQKICESKKLDKMLLWGSNNIYDFLDDYSRRLIHLDEKTNTISAKNITIQTKDKTLPYIIDATHELHIMSSNLTSLKNVINLDVPEVKFNDQQTTDFSNLVNENGNLYSGLHFTFTNCNNLNAYYFTKNIFNFLAFETCESKSLYDFSKYKNNKQIKFFKIYSMYSTDVNILNISYLLDNSVSIDEISFNFGYNPFGEKLNEITQKYLSKTNKAEHIMDFTLELIENDFDEGIL